MVRKLWFCLGSTVAAMLATAVWAQIPQAVAPVAPVPTQIASAKKVFISNMGTDTISAAFRMENKPYNEFYAAVKAWGRYQLVDSPADADLVYEIGFSAPIVQEELPPYYSPQFNLSIVDARTHFRLWTLLALVRAANGNFFGNRAIGSLASDKNLAAYVAAGVCAFGLGSSLYRPGMTAAAVRDTAQASVRAYDEAVEEAGRT